MKEKVEPIEGIFITQRWLQQPELLAMHAVTMKTQHALRPITKFVIVQGNQVVFEVMRCQ